MTSCDIDVPIMDDFRNEMDETFSILLSSSDPSACEVVEDNITVTILDDGRLPDVKCIHN